MTIRHQIEIETMAIVLFAAVIGTSFAFMSKSPKIRNVSLPIIAMAPISPTPTPLPAPVTTSQISPDGTKKLSMTKSSNKDGNKTFAFTVTNTTTNETTQVYTVALSDETMDIPYNAFSPDDRYLFLEYNSKNGTQAWVMRSDGQPINATTNEQYYNVTSLFQQKMPHANYHITTGWASETLLIILTNNADGSEGTSYWFEVPSKAIIPLSTQF
ncbi:MAG: hypothetical protein KGJ07_10015 [Patescibacteria group bacterium]|nr:hypothetical protein [Patescibacteria group bacterium]